TTISNHLIN
ncbi:hypothetical protein ZOSMA_7549G00010, partial [Zostera marina]